MTPAKTTGGFRAGVAASPVWEVPNLRAGVAASPVLGRRPSTPRFPVSGWRGNNLLETSKNKNPWGSATVLRGKHLSLGILSSPAGFTAVSVPDHCSRYGVDLNAVAGEDLEGVICQRKSVVSKNELLQSGSIVDKSDMLSASGT